MRRPNRAPLSVDALAASIAWSDVMADDATLDLQTVFETIPVGLVAVGADGALLAVNRIAARILNAPPDVLERGADLARLDDHLLRQAHGHGDDGAGQPPALRDLVEGPPGRQVEYRLSGARTLLATGTPVASGGGVVALTDLSLQAASERWARRGQTMRALGDMAGGVAHHFNTLLTVIIGFSRMAQSKPEEAARVTACMAEVLAAADRARKPACPW